MKKTDDLQMTSGMIAMSNMRHGFWRVTLFTCALMVGCAKVKSAITEYIVDTKDPSGVILRGPDAKYDHPISWCGDHVCYAYEEKDITNIKKYIATLEVKLKDCQKKQH
jgi:hypothetical protein